jgi:hypothetical protein
VSEVADLEKTRQSEGSSLVEDNKDRPKTEDKNQGLPMDEDLTAEKEHSVARTVWIVILILVIIGAGVYFALTTGLLF